MFKRRKSHNEEYRFGSAGFASEREIKAAGLFRPAGPHIGFVAGKPVYLDSDAPMITFGGAGSGKLRDVIGEVVCGVECMTKPMAVLDPRGEIAAISWHVLAAHGVHGRFWNPLNMHGLPCHSFNPLDILEPDSPNLHADTKFIVERLIALDKGDGAYFQRRAREYVSGFLKSLAERHGYVSFPLLHELVNAVHADPAAWIEHLKAMLESQFDDVRRIAAEIAAKQSDVPKEFSGIMGEIIGALSVLDDPVLLAALQPSEFSLADMVIMPGSDTPPTRLFLNVPAEYLGIWAPIIRVIFAVLMLYKSRAPAAWRVMCLVDEAGQLGKFEALLRGFSYGRGVGVRYWAFFQDIGQIERNFGRPAIQSFLGSAQMRQFFGVRDAETARLISTMLGKETLHFDAKLQQGEARRQRRNAVRSALMGADPFDVAADLAHLDQAQGHRTQQARDLLTIEEILNLPEDEQLLFIAGLNLKSVRASKKPYYRQRALAGCYLTNPFHPPTESVPIATWRGMRRAHVLSGPVPDHLAGFPQYENARALWVEGFERLAGV